MSCDKKHVIPVGDGGNNNNLGGLSKDCKSKIIYHVLKNETNNEAFLVDHADPVRQRPACYPLLLTTVPHEGEKDGESRRTIRRRRGCMVLMGQL